MTDRNVRRIFGLGLATLVLLASRGAGFAAAAETPRPGIVIDRVAAFVDGEAILASEVEAVIALRLVPPSEEEDPAQVRRRALNALVDDRLRARDLARFGAPDIPPDELEQEIDRAAARLGGRTEFEEIALRHGLDAAALRLLFERQLASIQAADDRFGSSVFVTDEDIANFLACDPDFRRRMADEGIEETPKLTPALTVEIRDLLVRRRLGEQLDRWMASLRDKAKIEILDASPPGTVAR